MLQKQFADFGDKMFDKDTAKIVRSHALCGAIVMALPLFGLDWIIFVVVLWHMYSSLCKRANQTLTLGNIVIGILVNVVIALIVDGALTLIPLIGWLGTAFIVYLQFYLSGKMFIENIKSK